MAALIKAIMMISVRFMFASIDCLAVCSRKRSGAWQFLFRFG